MASFLLRLLRIGLDGATSLESQGCTDKALLAISAKDNVKESFLMHVHVVNDQDPSCQAPVEEPVPNEDIDNDDDNSETEFRLHHGSEAESNFVPQSKPAGDDGSDEEFEFE